MQGVVKKQRILWLDIAKGISMIAIIMGHMGLSGINRVVFTFHVPLFYIVSGYLFHVETPLKTLVRKRGNQLLVPYILACLAICALSVPLNLLAGNDWRKLLSEWLIASLYGAGDTWHEPFYVRGIGAIWFLLAMFLGTILVKLCLEDLKKRIVVLIALCYVGIITASYIWLPWSIQAVPVAALYMLIGYWAGRQRIFEEKISVAAFLSAFVVWMVSIRTFSGFWLVHNYFGNGFLDFLGSLCAIYCVICISKVMDRHIGVLQTVFVFWGQNSLMMLCLHIIELNLFPWSRIHALLLSVNMTDLMASTVIIVLKIIGISAGVLILKLFKKQEDKKS